MLWVKAFHIIGVVVWFAGLFYLIRLYVYHASEKVPAVIERFEVMERRLYYAITVPGAWLTAGTGAWLLFEFWEPYKTQGWIHVKLALVLVLVGIHLYSGHFRKRFLKMEKIPQPVFFRVLNEVPTVLLIAIVILVVVKPF